MKLLREHYKKIVCCLVVILIAVLIVIYAIYPMIDVDTEESNGITVADIYAQEVSPKMLSDKVSTTVVGGSDGKTAELRYAIDGINSLASYHSIDNGEYLFELWNNMEQYYLHCIIDGDDKVYKVDMTDDTRDEVLGYSYSYYITLSSYLGIASKERITSFETVEGGYTATASIEESEYGLEYEVTDDMLKCITVLEGDSELVKIQFDKFSISDMSKYEDTDLTCDADYVREMFDYRTSE